MSRKRSFSLKVLSRTSSYCGTVFHLRRIFYWCPNFLKSLIYQLIGWRVPGRNHRPLDSTQWDYCKNSTHSMTGQLRGSSARSLSMIGLILHNLKVENVDQHWRADFQEMHQCTKEFLTENRNEEKMESSITRILWDTVSSKELWVCFSSCNERKMEMVKWIGKISLFLKRLKDSWMDTLPTKQHEWNPKIKSLSCWCGPRKWRTSKQKSRTSESGWTGNKRRVECYTGGSRRKAISIQW